MMHANDKKIDEINSEEWVEKSASFLQSRSWAQFQQSLGREAVQFNLLAEDPALIDHRGLANFYFYKLPWLGGYWYCPRGPVVDGALGLKKFIKDFSEVAKDLKKYRRGIFIRLEPFIEKTDISEEEFLKNGFVKSPHTTQPQKSLILDLNKHESDLVNEMHPKTRYNIHIAKKHGLEVREVGFIGAFLEILHETAKRDNFSAHADEYYKKLFSFFSDDKKSIKIKIYGAFMGEELLAANMMVFYGKRATYLHGASSTRHRNLMAPYILHWEIIQEAKKNGFLEYDFWGIDEEKWPGITRFKKGFGGKEVKYLGSYDFPVNKILYPLYRALSKIRK